MKDLFRDRMEAGQLLAAELTKYANRRDVIVLGLPRGGVPVAFEIAKRLHAPLDVFVVRKLGVPGHRDWWRTCPQRRSRVRSGHLATHD